MPSPLPQGGSRVPDVIEPIIAWRVWSLRSVRGRLELRAVFQDSPWPARSPMHASCRRGTGVIHRAPLEECSCGIYAARHAITLARQGGLVKEAAVIGSVSLWGKVVEHTGGYRAEFAYPDRLRLACRLCLSQGRVGAPSVLATSGDRVIPACDVHAPTVQGTPRDVADIQLELLSTYAVDLLPIEVLNEHGFSSGRPTPVTLAGAREEVIAKARSRGTGSLIGMLLVGWLALRAVGGILGPSTVAEDAPTPSPSPVVRADVPSVAPIVMPSPDPGGGAANTVPRRDRPPQLRFVCGTEITPGVVRLRCSDATTIVGAAWSPAQPRSRCFPGEAYTRKPRFSVCWLLIDGTGETVDGSHRILRLPRVHWWDIE